MSHVNALLTPKTRLRLALLVVETGWTYAAATTMFIVSLQPASSSGRPQLSGCADARACLQTV